MRDMTRVGERRPHSLPSRAASLKLTDKELRIHRQGIVCRVQERGKTRKDRSTETRRRHI